MNRLVQIACTTAITSVEAERSFSCLKLIKTNEEPMLDERLLNIAVLPMHAVRAKSIDLDKVLDRFVSLYPNCRIQLTNIGNMPAGRTRL